MALEVVSWCCFHLSFQVRNAALVTEEERIDVAKKIIIRARLCAAGCGSVHDLGNIKMMILCTKADGNCIHLLLFSTPQSSIQLYNHFLQIAAAINSDENGIKRQWLLDALEIGCVTAHPSTVTIHDVLLELWMDVYSHMLLP